MLLVIGADAVHGRAVVPEHDVARLPAVPVFHRGLLSLVRAARTKSVRKKFQTETPPYFVERGDPLCWYVNLVQSAHELTSFAEKF